MAVEKKKLCKIDAWPLPFLKSEIIEKLNFKIVFQVHLLLKVTTIPTPHDWTETNPTHSGQVLVV